MEKILPITGCFRGTVQIDYLPCLNYAMMLNNCKAFSRFTLQNNDSFPWEDVVVTLSGDMLDTCQINLQRLNAGEATSFENANLMPVATKLMALTEAMNTSFHLNISIGGQKAASQSYPLMLMAFDQWNGTTIMPELLAAFVTPNHPSIPVLNLEASKYLEAASGCRNLDDYQSQDYLRVKSQVEAVYTTLQKIDFTYATAPASFEDYGQRIRLIDKLLKDRMGNCIELSLLMCSCLESIGIRTILLLFQGHAMMGVWLAPDVLLPMVGTDSSTLSSHLRDGQRKLIILESTYLAEDKTFSEAVNAGEELFLKGVSKFECFIDIRMARINHIRPLPHCIKVNDVWEMNDTTDYDTLFDELAKKNPYDIHGTASAEKLRNKQLLWERKLLDLSLRNGLLNMKSGKHVIPLKNLSIEEILTHLKSETLIGDIDEADNFATIKELYRAARNSIEENGANTLFLSVGTMRWYEADDTTPFFAPVLFLPLEIVRHGARKYLIRLRDEEPLMNITLLEMMRQTFELEIPSLSPVPENEEDMVDWQRVFDILRTCIAEINEKRSASTQWEIVEECMIGIFSFTKFVMWNDIHSNANVLARQPIISSLIEGRLTFSENDDIDVRQLDRETSPADYAIPVDVDSSQLEAVVNAGKGHSFILYGPPGTGKSQTITNIIANALYQNKRVLFVAEKKAALDVVQDRLSKIGLDPYCLELHSNKVDKKSFLAQMELAVNQTPHGAGREYRKTADNLFQQRKQLNGYIEALHKVRQNGLSLYDYINRYLDIEGECMALNHSAIKRLTIAQLDELCTLCRQLDTVESIIGRHPGMHPLLGLFPRENTASNQNAVTEVLKVLPDTIVASRNKAMGWINRWFLKRTPLEILERKDEWQQFFEVADTDEDIKENIDLFEPSVSLWSQNADLLRQWYHYSLRAQQIAAFGVPEVLEYYLHGKGGSVTADAFRKGYYYRMAMNVIDNDPSLRSFNGMLFEDIIQSYRKIADEFKELTKQELCSRLSMRVPQPDSGDKTIDGELALLRKRIANHGRGTSVRRILDQTQHILPRLCPCMLMSPLSVAQYLQMSNNQFDLVVFDEASQMPTSEAVGAIARGRSVVVVGDPKQMPPTSFFMSQNTNDDDADIDDLESILDDCISLSLPSLYLNWHYRSKHESLIAFSNTHFYDGRLITFPSVDDLDRKVTLQHIDGYYDFGKSRSNKAEAKAIVEDVMARLSSMLPSEDGSAPQSPVRSIGIVAFSKVQSNLIEDMLMDALAKKPELEKLAMKSAEPVFVKNLENVQGDERDIILFSVGYGPDKSGKVSMNFGPLNQVGGERRLNVAVSRARYEMKVFSTLASHQIDLSRTNAQGVKLLKRFLEYAETGALPKPMAQVESDEVAPVVQQIAEKLRAEGHTVHTNVGRSKFKIDIAVVDENNPSRYSMGIITDSKSYYSTPTARDREIVQPKVLSLLGWDVRHAWTADWIENKTINKII